MSTGPVSQDEQCSIVALGCMVQQLITTAKAEINLWMQMTSSNPMSNLAWYRMSLRP